MSGSTIGGVVGGVIGFVVTGFNPAGAQWGFMIGSMVGAAVDPDKIAAPDGRDAQEQTTTDGIPIPVVYGSPPPFMGTVLDGENKARRIKGKYRSGKGGPKVQDPDSYLWTGAILICEGDIAGVAFIVRNGVLVADWRANPKIPAAETAKFASKIRLYLGDEAQNPDPALETIHGVGNTPYYRGRAYMVIVDDDVTDTAGRIAQYAFGVVKSGQTQTVTTTEYAEPALSGFDNSLWPLINADIHYQFDASLAVSGGGYDTYTGGSSVDEVIAHYRSLHPARSFNTMIGWSAGDSLTDVHSLFYQSGFIAQPDITDNRTIYLVFGDATPVRYVESGYTGALCPLVSTGERGVFLRSGDEITKAALGSLPGFIPGFNCGSGDYILSRPALFIAVTRKRIMPVGEFGDPCDDGSPVLLPDSPSFIVDCDANIEPWAAPTIVTSGGFRRLSREMTATVDNRTQYTSYGVGPVIPASDPNAGNQAFWEAAYAEAVANGEPVGLGWVYGVDYPSTANATDAPVHAFQQTLAHIEPDAVFLREVQEDIAYRCGVPSERIDADDLSAIPIPGYMVATGATGANASRGLQPMFFYDMPEVDGAIRCVRRGKASVGEITDADFVDVEESDEDIRSQQVEFPRKIHLAYPDPDLNYAITKQTFAREASSVISVDEQIVSTTIPFSGDDAAKIADIMGKVAWASAEGRIKCTLPREFTLWTPADCFNYRGKRWLITKAEYDSYATIKLEALYDRAPNYASIATGKGARAPGSQTSGLRGPTRLETINLSPLLDADDRLGLFFGVCGILDGWAGGVVSASIDGGASYTTLGTWRDPSVMGHTTTELPASPGLVFDASETVTVKVHGGELDSASFLQILNEANACVIGDEAIQFADAVEVDDYTYTLTGLTRARHGTEGVLHPIHSRFVLLGENLNFVDLPASWIGRTITLHVQSIGTPSGTGYTETFIWQPASSQTEWPPFRFRFEHDGSSTRISWIGRGRLGSTATPFHSSFFEGYRIVLTDGVTTVAHTTADQHFDYSDTQRSADFGSLDPLTVEVAAMNRITGASPALTGII